MYECARQQQRGSKKKSNCMCALMHICESVCTQVYLFMYCIVMFVYICGCMCGRMCAECDVCRQSALNEKCKGTQKFHERLLTALKLNCICVFLESLGTNESRTQEVLSERGSN